MRMMTTAFLMAVAMTLPVASAADVDDRNMVPPIDLRNHPSGTWIKRTPGPGAPVNPRMGYEASLGWDSANGVLIRWGGHNQGGGGEQNFETWHYDPVANTFDLIEPNTSPPGNCCCRDNVFDPVLYVRRVLLPTGFAGRYRRFHRFEGGNYRRDIDVGIEIDR